MMAENKNIPEIRFAGFADPWEQRKLSEYLDVSNEKNTEDIFTKQDVLSVSGDFGIVNQIEFQGRSFAGASVSNYGVVHTGDVVYTKSPLNSNPYGIIKTNKGKPGIVSTLYAVYHPKENVDPAFVQTYFEQHARMNNYMHPLVNKGAKNDMKVSSENALKGDVIFPSVDEQRQIVALFAKVDSLLTLHQRKYDRLKNVKKSMLEKMFPRDGANVPEIRFAGFTDAWEQRKLGEIGEVITGSTPSTQHPEYYSEDGMPWVTPTDIVDNIIYDTPRKLSPIGEKVGRVVPADTILVTCIASIGKNAMLVNTGSFNQQINGLVPDKKKYDPYFLLTESFHWSAKMKREAAAGTMQIVNKNEFSAIETYVPELSEQKAIGAYFCQIDKLITLHQRKYEKLKQIKKSMLEKMFV